ncbi:hypothetical protein [Cellulomonas sp. S1-8]|uniref:hypothetical protein n=1 Tax=Cellulomonas sp. S1-8 TaxID=2904790 RepID=UPI002243C125|nr:hypothetical protein [Cellulomonas sp. S1-8]UZN02670.1 hypothetical protein OKX07_16680 [Cellulomonas sp. S1-8]
MRPTTRPPARRALTGLAVGGVLVLLGGCTGDADGPVDPPSGSASQTAGEPAPPPVDDVAAQVIAEQTIDTPVGSENAGGTLTLTLRDVRVDAEVMTLRWALRWDAADPGSEGSMSLFSLGVEPTPVVTDTTNLRAYMPLCTQGAWNAGGAERSLCRGSMLASPVSTTSTQIANGSTLEGWAALPAPDPEGGSLDVLIAEGLPVFSGVTAVAAS